MVTSFYMHSRKEPTREEWLAKARAIDEAQREAIPLSLYRIEWLNHQSEWESYSHVHARDLRDADNIMHAMLGSNNNDLRKGFYRVVRAK